MTISTELVKVSMCTASRQYQAPSFICRCILAVSVWYYNGYRIVLTGHQAVTSLQKDPQGETSDCYERDICKVMEFVLPMGHIQCCQLVV